MEIYISDQCLQFLLCAGLGGGMAILYEFPRILRQMFSHSFPWVVVEDILYCVISSFFFILISYSVSDGIIRWYYYAGALLGFIIYWFSVGVLVRESTVIIIGYIKKTVRIFYNKCIKPLAKFLKMLIIPIVGFCKHIRKLTFMLFKKKKKKPTKQKTQTSMRGTFV